MGKIIQVEGDIVSAPEKYIAHQCNCMTNYAGGLAFFLFKAFPWSDIYSDRKTGKPVESLGDIVVKGNGADQRYVINMMAQFYPGASKYLGQTTDSAGLREKAFQECLNKIAAIKDLESIAFPYRIGCGLAGGDWSKYEQMLNGFADTTTAKVVVYRRPGD